VVPLSGPSSQGLAEASIECQYGTGTVEVYRRSRALPLNSRSYGRALNLP